MRREVLCRNLRFREYSNGDGKMQGRYNTTSVEGSLHRVRSCLCGCEHVVEKKIKPYRSAIR